MEHPVSFRYLRSWNNHATEVSPKFIKQYLGKFHQSVPIVSKNIHPRAVVNPESRTTLSTIAMFVADAHSSFHVYTSKSKRRAEPAHHITITTA